jgi:hypothetical protein
MISYLPALAPAADHAHQDRLHDALRFDALGQLVQAAFVHAGAGLVDACHHDIE